MQRLHEHVAALESERVGVTDDGRAAGPSPAALEAANARAAEAEALAARLQAEGEALADLVDSLQVTIWICFSFWGVGVIYRVALRRRW